MEAVLQDLRYAARALRKSPAFTGGVVLTLALSIGATTAMFSVADALIGHPVRGIDTDRLAVVAVGQKAPAAAADYLDWAPLTRSFERLCAYRQRDGNLTGADLPERVYVAAVNPDFFAVLKADAAIGRTLGSADDGDAAVLSHALWRRRFGSDPAVVGRVVGIDDRPHTIVGVMPEDFQFPVPTDVWVPLTLTPAERASRDVLTLRVVGRLKPSTTVAEAQAELSQIARQLEIAYPATNLNRRVHVMPLDEFVQGNITRRAIFMLLVMVGVVLLVTCANITGLQLARATDRRREIAVRTALGAPRGRVVQQVLVENALLAALGGTLSIAVASACIHALQRSMPLEIARLIPGFNEIAIDGRALMFTAAVAIVTSVLTAAGPALRSTGADPADSLNDARTAGLGGSRQRLRHVFVAGQLAVAFVLVLTSSILVNGFDNLLRTQIVHDPDRVLVMSVSLPPARYRSESSRAQFYYQVVARLGDLSGVRDAATFTSAPLSNNGTTWTAVDVENQITPSAAGPVRAVTQSVTPGFFQLMRIGARAGRLLESADDASHPRVAVISRVMAAHVWSDGSALGRRIRLGTSGDRPWVTVVGVVDDVMYDWTDRVPEFVVYVPTAQSPAMAARLAIRVNGDPASFAQSSRQQIAAVDPLLPAFEVMSLGDSISESLAGASQIVWMMRLLGLLSAAIGVMGLSGLMAYLVSTRTREFGVRMALGAAPADIFRSVMIRGVLLAGIGLVCGTALAIPTIRAVRGLVFEAGSGVWRESVTTAALFTLVSLVTSVYQARRATKSDPMVALRSE